MKLQTRSRTKSDWKRKVLQGLNLRPEEGERTFLMFVFYTATSIGLIWLEQVTVAIFLSKFGVELLPVIYIASALMGSALGFSYSLLEKFLPIRRVLITVSLIMALPLILFRVGLGMEYFNGFIALGTVFALRLWMDAEDILNDLNAQVAANQIFNIREIKRTYPLVASGLLVGDVIAGFSLPLLLTFLQLEDVIILACVAMLGGAGSLYFLTQRYKQSFPDTPTRDLDELQAEYASNSISASLRKYIIPLFAFFILGEVLFLLVEFQYLGELERVLTEEQIAGFLGLFSGVLGVFELLTQLFISSRAVERLGVFVAAMFLPVSLSILGLVTLVFDANVGASLFKDMKILFLGVIVLKFFDELLRYTLIAGIEPALFQPIPERIRGSIQTRVQGIAEPLSTGFTGLAILAIVWFVSHQFTELPEEASRQVQGGIFIGAIVVFSIIWATSAWLLRSSYVSLLVQSAEQGRLGFLSVDLKAFKKAILEALEEKEAEADKLSCIQLLERIDPPGAGEVLAPLLASLSPALQRESLGAMVKYPDRELRPYVQKIIEQKPNLDVLALALRYMWLSQAELDTNTLIPYLNERVDPIVRGTAASLILRRGNPYEKAEATNTLERMLSSQRERDRTIGIKALQEVDYLPIFAKRYIPELLQDESARVRCALLEMIGAKNLEKYYSSLVKGLYYRSTREAARNALVLLDDDGTQILAELTGDIRKPDMVRLQGWNALAQIATPKALTQLVQQLMSNWGANRRSILRILLKIPGDRGIEAVLEQLGRSGVETMIKQELLLLGQVYSASLDFDSELVIGREADLLRAALNDLQSDIIDRCFLLMKLLYPFSAIQAAMFNLNSDSQANIALGLEILDNTLDIPTKGVFLELLDRGTTQSKLAALESLVVYQPLTPPERLRHLVEFRHFLSDWSLACCFYLARQAHWTISIEATLVCLRHPSAFVREAVLVYLREASPRTCSELLPALKNDPNPLVVAQVQQIIGEMGHPTVYKP